MSATDERELAISLVKSDPQRALAIARKIADPWFRAQALSWAVRFTDVDTRKLVAEAAAAARECDDDYKRSAVRAWEVAALAERSFKKEAREVLGHAVDIARNVLPFSSRSEALLLLLQAAFRIDDDEAAKVYTTLRSACPVVEHWRCKRAIRVGGLMISGEYQPRPFFW